MRLSAVILSRNEAKNIGKAIKSVSFCDEVIVIDDFSGDKTETLAKKMGARVIKRDLSRDFAAQRNFGLREARGDWVLFLDADEAVSSGLKEEIIKVVNVPKNKIDGYFIKRRDLFFGKELNLGEVGNAKFIRLAKNGSGEWRRKVHEVWDLNGEIGNLRNPILHFPHPTLSEFVSDINFTSSIHASENIKEDKTASLFQIIFWPKLKFLNNYFIKGGFLDGTHGFVLALFMSFHSFLSWSKQWLLKNNSQKNQ